MRLSQECRSQNDSLQSYFKFQRWTHDGMYLRNKDMVSYLKQETVLNWSVQDGPISSVAWDG